LSSEPASSGVTAEPGVLVLGMHRSGTSIVTQLLEALGLALCPAADLIPADAANPTGYCESRTVVACNELLLAAAGAHWWCPPGGVDRPMGDLTRPVLRALADAFTSVHPAGPWVCKDPRLCLTAGTWWRALAVPRVAVVVLRNPLEIAQSLEDRSGLPVPYGLALWERYLREVVRICEGAAVYLDEYERLLADPAAWVAGLARFIDSTGVARTGDGDRASRLVRPGLHRQVVAERRLDESGVVSHRQRELYRALRALRGAHRRWEGPPMGQEPGAVNVLFEAVRRTTGFGELRGLVLDRVSDVEATSEPVARLRSILFDSSAMRH
jgi:hypothetical protein